MRFFGIALLGLFISGMSIFEVQAENFCLNPEVAVKKVHLDNGLAVISTARVEFAASTFGAIELASEKAELEAKAALSKYLQASKFFGLRKLFECQMGRFVYVGVMADEINENTANHMKQLLTNSIKSQPTPQ